jgi:hypothetical protein
MIVAVSMCGGRASGNATPELRALERFSGKTLFSLVSCSATFPIVNIGRTVGKRG